MTVLQIQFLVGLFFIVNDSRNLLEPITLRSILRILLGVLLIVLCALNISIVR